jgi:hypothetical protein
VSTFIRALLDELAADPVALERLRELVQTEAPEERWLDKKEFAEYLACSTRSIEFSVVDGMPHAVIYGRVKFRISEAEPWLEAHGQLERRGSTADTVPNNNGMARQRVTATGPRHEE